MSSESYPLDEKASSSLSTLTPETVPDHAPIVAFDVELGKTHSSVDFDYAAYAEQAEQVGLSPEDAAALMIRVAKPPQGSITGYYRPRSENYPGFIYASMNDSVNKTLAHELQHAADDAEGKLISDLRHKVGMIGVRLSSTALGIGTGALVTSIVSKIAELPPALESTLEYGSPSALIASTALGAWIYGYHFNPHEMAARHAEARSIDVIKATACD